MTKATMGETTGSKVANSALNSSSNGTTASGRGDHPVGGTATATAGAAATDQQAALASAAAADPQDGQIEEAPIETGHRFMLFNVMPGWLVSFLFHLALILLLALTMLRFPPQRTISLEAGDGNTHLAELSRINFDTLDLATDPLDTPFEVADPVEIVEQFQDVPFQDTFVDATDLVQALQPLAMSEAGEMAMIGADSNPVSSRTPEMRRRMLQRYGGTAASESAVALALKWLAAHQLPDGSWDFDHRIGPGSHRTSPNPGRSGMRVGATAMALLPFLGAGQTHLEGEHRETVSKGLAYLIRTQRATNGDGGSLWEEGGTMYSHGLAAICLTEAYAMTRDPDLRVPAQGAINYIVHAQDPVGGGWRYRPRTPGDTSAVGWQVMALKSGQMGALRVPGDTLRRASRFLDSVAEESGAYYGYMNPGRVYSTTSVGLLSRMLLGWQRDTPALQRGVQWLSSLGPAVTGGQGGRRVNTDMYHNYYATQVMRHYGGEEWEQWNVVMRDFLVDSQEKNGAAEGSWYFRGDRNAEIGGRLFCTSLAAMTLEVYYRYLPLYQEEAVIEEFPLD